MTCTTPRHLPHATATRRRLLSTAALTVAALATPFSGAFAADAKPYKLLVGFPAGGGTDAIARCWARSSRTNSAPR